MDRFATLPVRPLFEWAEDELRAAQYDRQLATIKNAQRAYRRAPRGKKTRALKQLQKAVQTALKMEQELTKR